MITKKKGKRKVMFCFICILSFVVSLIGSALFKISHKPSWSKKYSVSWNNSIGTLHKDISYGDGEKNKFDMYFPADNTKQTYGLVVYIHAGGFTTGDKSDDKEMLQWLCSKGYVAVGVNYTLRDNDNPNASVYSQSIEIKNSIPVIKETAEKMGYKLDKMAISGGSAGGTLALLYGYRDANTSPIPVKMIFEAVGPASFYPKDWSVYGLDKSPEAAAGLFSVMSGNNITKEMIGTSEYEVAIKDISAYKWVNDKSVPTLCAYGVYDKVCPFDSSKHLINALKEHNVPHDYIEFPHSGHALQNDNKLYIKYMEKINEYLNKYMEVK